MAKAKKNHIGILSKMLAALTASDAEPEEIEEAVDAIEELTSVEEEAPVEEKKLEEGTDEDPNAMIAALTERIEKLEAALAAKEADEEPAEEPVKEEEDPLKTLEDDLEAVLAEEKEEEEPVTPDEDPDEMESHFVDPEELNEEDEDETEEVEVTEEVEPETMDCKGRDALREVVKAMRPIIAQLPEKERRKAADALSENIRKASGLDKKPARNDYQRLKTARKRASDSEAVDEDAALAKRIMEKRNANYIK